MTAADRRVLLGHISSAHGLRGEVLLKTYTGAPADIASYGALSDESGARRFEVRVVRVTDKGVIARIAGVGDRTAAEKLRGVKLYVGRDQLPEAIEGEYYHADLIGLSAVADDGRLIGEIVAIPNYGAGDLLEIRLDGTRKTDLVPFTDACVPEVDLRAGRVVVRMPEFVPGEDVDGTDDDRGAGSPPEH